MPRLNETVNQTFNRDGFLIIENLFTRREAQQLKADMHTVLNRVAADDLAAGKSLDAVMPSGVYVGVAAQSALVREMMRDNRLLDILTAIIGPNIEFLSDKAVFKNSTTHFASPWHQDWTYWQGGHKTSIWVALDDATPDNGCLKLLPGSHRTVADHDHITDDERGFGRRLKPEAIDESQAVTAAIEAGGAVFFHDLTLHASHPNTTGQDRWVWIPTYRDARNDDPDYSFAVANTVVRGSA